MIQQYWLVSRAYVLNDNTSQYCAYTVVSLLTNQYWTRPDFHNGRGTTPVLPNTGLVLEISTAPFLVEYGDEDDSPVLTDNTSQYCAYTVVSLLANQYWARPDFHNGRGTTPVLPDTGLVLEISTAPVLAEYGDDYDSPALAWQ